MVNTRILTQELKYFEPTTLQEALELLDRYGADAKVIAGGTDLLVQMKLEMASPRYLIGTKKISELNILENRDFLRIGAATLLRDVLSFCSGEEEYVALCEAIRSLATVQIRNVGTIGGNLCNASPAADSAPPLLALDTRIRICSSKGNRVVPLTEFFKDVNLTVIEHNEIVTQIEIPPIPENSGSAFLKVTRVGAGFSKVNAAAFFDCNDNVCQSCRIALGCVAPVPLRLSQVEAFLAGKRIEVQVMAEAGKIAAEEIKPISDIRSTAEYRRRVSAVLVEEVLRKAWKRTGAHES